MSATRDKNQKVAFVYSNLYQIYRKGKEAAQAAEVQVEEAAAKSSSNHVLKVEDLNQQTFGTIHVRPHNPPEFLGKRVQRPEALNQAQGPRALKAVPSQAPKQVVENPVIDSLKENLKSLTELHERLNFMLRELEDLVKE